MNTKHLYYKIEQEPNFLDQVKEYAKTVNWIWIPFMNIALDFPKTLGFQLIKTDKMLSGLQSKFNAEMRLYMFPSMTVYNWHRDVETGCSLNLVMDDYSAHTLFNPNDKKEIIDSVVELKYEKNKWYLFNSQILHSVINVDSKDRVLLTITFPKNVTYNDVADHLKSEGILSN
jgi:hypothetical protein